MKRDKKSIRIHILNLQDQHCAGCKKVPTYGKSGNHKISWCMDNCEIGKQLKQFGDTLLEGRNEKMVAQMAEEKKEGVKKSSKGSRVKKNTKPLAEDTKVVKKKTEHSEGVSNGVPQTELQAALEKLKQQLQEREEAYTILLNEFNQLSEKKWEIEAELRKAQIRIGAAEETVGMERKHRLELQARAQALGIALKAIV
ncbi:hypothetical protein ABE44_35455 [Bacillus thuringiensis]|uniref:zinc-finger domain-containing protein n=1 Tax=Bacillus thuringiensis TaxID=1428 RepID=UPI0018CEFDFB|nr:zinc-finger domain-containing protein [Bacillus thuringiensis]MBG9504150.1 hypothetical protein [Bacillus thuringiensis]